MASDHIARDSRGILDPGRMAHTVSFARYEPPTELCGIVQWFWSVSWDLRAGDEFVQPVLSHPSANLSVGPRSTRGLDDDRIEATAVGVIRTVDRRRLRGTGWNVAAKLEPGAFGAFLQVDAATLTDRIVPLSEATTIAGDELAAQMEKHEGDLARQVNVLARAIAEALERADPQRVAAARETAGLGGWVESDRDIRNVAQLARASGIGVRTLQRLFREHAGVSPLWMIRRYRLIDAADAARNGRPPSWGELAAALGYSDQAHLSRDFKAVVGQPPAQYADSVTPLSDAVRPPVAAGGSVGR